MRLTFRYAIICLTALTCAAQLGCGTAEIADLAWETERCDPDLRCSTTLTCFEGKLYPTSCGPVNCDAPIGPC